MAENGKPKAEFRALPQGYELRSENGEMPTLVGGLAVFNEWTEIDSRAEGHFMEQIEPRAFDKTISENRDRMRVLFQHGQDPQVGDKPLGPIASLTSSERAVDYEVPLLDTTYNRDLLPGLQAGLYGSSFRFEVLRQNWNDKPKRTEHNPEGLRERTIKEVRMVEFGPVTFPAYAGTSAGIRSLTDRMGGLEQRLDAEDLGCLAEMISLGASYIGEQDEGEDTIARMEAILASLAELVPVEAAENEPPEDDEMASANERAAEADDAPPNDRAGDSHPIRGRRVQAVPLYTAKKEVDHRWRL